MSGKGKAGEQGTAPKDPNMQLSKDELDRVTEVFKMYETGLREATIYPKVNYYKLNPSVWIFVT